jgi:hypothetical protein
MPRMATRHGGLMFLRKATLLVLIAKIFSFTASATPEAVPGEFVVKLKQGATFKALQMQDSQNQVGVLSTRLGLAKVKRSMLEKQSFSIKALSQLSEFEYIELYLLRQ